MCPDDLATPPVHLLFPQGARVFVGDPLNSSRLQSRMCSTADMATKACVRMASILNVGTGIRHMVIGAEREPELETGNGVHVHVVHV